MLTQKSVRKAVALAAMAAASAASQAAVLNFDDLVSTFDPAREWFTADYNGFRFGDNNPSTTSWFFSNDATVPYYQASTPTQYAATVVVAGGPFEPTQSITSEVDFRFQGAMFSGFDKIRFQLYRDGQLVWTSQDSAELTSTPAFVSSGYYSLIDEVVVIGSQGFFAMDDFTYTGGTVPEPAGLALVFTAGLAGFLATRRRKQG